MASLSVHSFARARSRRPRRRRLFLAEVLETRRLLSAAALPHAIAPASLAPALVGPMTPSAGTTSPTGTTSPAAGALSQLSSGQPASQIVIPIYTLNFNLGNPNETLVIVEFSGNPGFSSAASSGSSTVSQGPVATFSGTTGGMSALSTTTTDTSGPTAQTPSITPLTAVILSGPSVGGRDVVVVILPQPLVANLGPSAIPATDQAILATAALEEMPLGPPVLGQGFESPVGEGFVSLFGPNLMSHTVPGWLDLVLPPTDYIEPMNAAPAIPEPAAPAPDQPAVPVPTDANAVTEILLDPVALSDWGKMPASPILTSDLDAPRHDEYPTWSLAAMIGTTAIATGGYQLVLGGSARLNQRWLPIRRSASRRRAVIR